MVQEQPLSQKQTRKYGNVENQTELCPVPTNPEIKRKKFNIKKPSFLGYQNVIRIYLFNFNCIIVYNRIAISRPNIIGNL